MQLESASVQEGQCTMQM